MYAVGVDLGGTNVVAGLVDDTGAILRKRSVPTNPERGNEFVIKDIADLCIEVSDPVGGMEGVVSVGVGCPGIVNPKRGIIDYACNLGMEQLNMSAALSPYFSTPVYVENDANCAAFGESISGASKDYDHSVAVTLGTGIGCGIIIHRRIYRGAFYGAGEVGHMSIMMDGVLCGCGRKGCWEAYASAQAITRQAKALAEKDPKGGLAKLVGGDIEKITAKHAFEAADNADPGAMKLVDRYMDYLAEGLANVANTLQPDVIVVGGGIANRGEDLIYPLRDRVRQRSISSCKRVELVLAQLGNDAGVVGAAMLTGC